MGMGVFFQQKEPKNPRRGSLSGLRIAGGKSYGHEAFLKMGGVLQYKWEAYCTVQMGGVLLLGFPVLQGLEVRKVQRNNGGRIALQISLREHHQIP